MNASDRYDSLIAYYAELHGRDPRQVKRQIRVESAFTPTAKSAAGALGLMQFMPATWHDIGWPGEDPMNPEASIRAGCRYMATLEQMTGRLDLALAAYNWGIGHILKIKAAPDWRDLLPAETQGYLTKCLGYETETVLG